ncbi:hypothetical protein Lepto7375DRAFT_1940 [Leptolyngbya sp. PCC 7375]|nr:hypothetical protein Lepto7375DRAFT_1940 [Leptolyngbya sp. PCC 7375]
MTVYFKVSYFCPTMVFNSPQAEWRTKTLQYVAAINAFVEVGLRDGWDQAGEEPEVPDREHLANAAIDAVRQANQTGNLVRLREQWPPAHQPFIHLLQENGQSIPMVCILPDSSILARIGAVYESGRVVHIVGDTVSDVPDVEFFGCGPNRRYFAIAAPPGIHITDGWNGPITAICPWPTGLEGIPDSFDAVPLNAPPNPTKLIPFPDGTRVLLVSADGIFVLSPEGASRLLPRKSEIQEFFEWLQENHPDDDLSLDLSMEHGTLSKDGRLIVVGAQDSFHLVFDAQLNLISEIGPHSEYPHYALFSADESMMAFNACHFYNGTTIGVPTHALKGMETDFYEEDSHIIELEDGARVYAGVSRQDEFIVGDASGYIRAFSTAGDFRWQLFIGSAISSMDLSSEGKILVVSTYAGFLSIIQLDAGTPAPHQIGTDNHVESHRWLFWKNEPMPLIW